MTQHSRGAGCAMCAGGHELEFEIEMALQPIVNVDTRQIYAQEALVRGPNGESAGSVIGRVNDDNRYRFDQSCRVKAIELAAQLGLESMLSINFMPNAVYQPERCIRTTLATAEACGFPHRQIIFEVTEGERVKDHGHLRAIIQCYQELGFRTAIDDFGAGYSGLNLLADFQPDLIKLDMALVRNIDRDKPRRAIVGGVLRVCDDLGIEVIAEGVETREELVALRDLGIKLFQGYYFAKPAFKAQAAVEPARFELPRDRAGLVP